MNSKRKLSIVIGILLVIMAAGFITYALNHPESSFTNSNRIAYLLYGGYSWLIVKCLVFIPFLENVSKKASLKLSFRYLYMVIIFGGMELTGTPITVFTILRGFVIFGAAEECMENTIIWMKDNVGN